VCLHLELAWRYPNIKKFYSLFKSPTAGLQFQAELEDASARLHSKVGIGASPQPSPGAVVELAAAQVNSPKSQGLQGRG